VTWRRLPFGTKRAWAPVVAAAERLKKRYTVLVFTAATKDKLHQAMPKQIADPASNPESWQPRAVYEYILVE
jgi:hypothetical protein